MPHVAFRLKHRPALIVSASFLKVSDTPTDPLKSRMSSASTPNIIAYVDDVNLRRAANRIPVVHRRRYSIYKASMVHELIKAYGLLEKMTTVPSWPASEDEVKLFHSSEYVAFLKTAQPALSNQQSHEEEQIEDDFGLGFDCPVLPSLWSMARHLAGGSLTGAKLLTSGSARVAINWCGGWHHAQRDSASGFCYVNDIVLAILHLRQHFMRVAYVDLDVHHGDGVEDAFSYSGSVMTTSLHLKEDGFFPGTGHSEDLGHGEGQYFTLNVPYKAGISNQSFVDIVKCIIEGPLKTFSPGSVVVQCGGDALALDKLGGANLTLEGYAGALSLLLDLQLPTLLLGGGGYEPSNVARLWTYLTAVVLGVEVDSEIPEHNFFELYGPSFDLHISSSNRRDENSQDFMDSLRANIQLHGEKLRAKMSEKKNVGQLTCKTSNSPFLCYKQKKQNASEIIGEALNDESSTVADLHKLEPLGGQTQNSYRDVLKSSELEYQTPEHFDLASTTLSGRWCKKNDIMGGIGTRSPLRIDNVPSKKRKVCTSVIPSQVEQKSKSKDVFEFDDDDF
ncbi:Histone deacetylase domain [Trinorchestia longiramus]|nr:Histone deacetylase domain [Trinorchestia longiramus]